MKAWFKLLQPTALEMVVYFFISAALLFIASFSSVLDALIDNDSTRDNIRDVGGLVSGNVENLFAFFDGQDQAATITTLVFWSVAGAILYMVIWSGINGVIEFQNNSAVAKEFVHGQKYDDKEHWTQYFGRVMFRFFAGLLTLFFVLTFIKTLGPLWVELFSLSVNYLGEALGWLMLPASIIGMAITMHIFTIMFRLLAMRVRLYGDLTQA